MPRQGGGIRQRLGLASRRWGARPRSPRAPRDPEPGPDPPLGEGQPLDLAEDFRNFISELLMENIVRADYSEDLPEGFGCRCKGQ